MEKQIARYKIIKALFAEAKKLGINQETLRDDITPGVINKRLSVATPQEIAKVLIYIHNRHGVPDAPPPAPSKGGDLSPAGGGLGGGMRYESSRAGLLEEIRDLAIARFGEDYALPLNAFCARFGETDGFRKMRVNQMKIIKQRLKELQREDPRGNPPPAPQVDQASLPDSIITGRDACSTKVITFQKGRKGFFDQLRGL